MVEIRTKKGRNGRTYRYPINNRGSSGFIQKSIKHPGRVRETIQRWYGKDGFDSKGRIKPEYLIKAKQKAKEEHNRSLEDAIDLAMRLKKMDESHPYGESRAEAEAEVQKLREEGDKARLIKTNEKNDLYAPYEGTLPADKGDDEKKQEPEVTQASPDNTPRKIEEQIARPENDYATLSVNRSKGYTGKTRFQGWVSEPLMPGEHSREFIHPDHMDWGDSQLYRKNKGQWDAVYHLPPDHLYDMNEGGGAATEHIVTYRRGKTGEVVYTSLSEGRYEKILQLIHEGKSVQEARIMTLTNKQGNK